MSFTYDDDETSIQDGEPVDLVIFAYPGGTTRYAGGERTFSVDVGDGNGVQTWTAKPVQSGQKQLVGVTEARDAEVTIPVSDPVALTYLAFGPPPRELQVVVYRYMVRSGGSRRQFGGYASSLQCKGHEATFRVPNGTEDAIDVSLPTMYLQRTCGTFLYDKRCGLSRAAFSLTTLITGISVSQLVVTVAAVPTSTEGVAPPVAFGIVEHLASTECRSVVGQNGLQLSLNLPLRNAAIGDPVSVSLGCDKLPTTCRDKFANVPNFRGHPFVQMSNPFIVGLNLNRGQ